MSEPTMNELYFLFIILMKAFVTLASLSLILVSCSLYQKTTPIVETPKTPEVTVAPVETSTEQTAGVDANTTKEAPIATPETTTTPEPTKPATKSYTAADVATHNSASSCWLILDAKVYDVTKFIPSHPGGNDILKGCGKDATKMFSKHPESAKAMKEQFYIGDLK